VYKEELDMKKVVSYVMFLAVILIAEQGLCFGKSSHVSIGASSKTVMDTEKNIIGQKIIYPAGQSRIFSQVIDLPPHASIPWHEHLVPMYAYIIKGEIVVDYGSEGVKTIREGEAMVEAINFRHKGANITNKTAKILIVYISASGQELEKIYDSDE
jgi:quercetin dioxygenase-like cupin family protein